MDCSVVYCSVCTMGISTVMGTTNAIDTIAIVIATGTTGAVTVMGTGIETGISVAVIVVAADIVAIETSAWMERRSWAR
jgi:hypothetical protein